MNSDQANSVIPYASADAKMHPDRGPWRRGPHAMAQLALIVKPSLSRKTNSHWAIGPTEKDRQVISDASTVHARHYTFALGLPFFCALAIGLVPVFYWFQGGQ